MNPLIKVFCEVKMKDAKSTLPHPRENFTHLQNHHLHFSSSFYNFEHFYFYKSTYDILE